MSQTLEDIIRVIRENRDAELKELRRAATELYRKVQATPPLDPA